MSLRPSLFVTLLLVATAVSAPGQAFVISGSAGTVTSTAGASTQVNFDTANGSLVSSVSGMYGLNAGSNPGGGGNWAGISTDPGLTITFNTLLDYVGFLWGTPDNYNDVSLYDGATLIAGPFSDSVVSGGNFTNFFASSLSEDFDIVVFNSGSCCFEIDNIAARAAAPVPEPGAFMLLSGALGLLGLARRYL